MIQDKIFVELKDKRRFELRTPQSNEAQVTLDTMIEIAAHSPYCTVFSGVGRILEFWFVDLMC